MSEQERHIKIKSYYFTPQKFAKKIKSLIIANIGKSIGKWKHSLHAGGNINWYNHSEEEFGVSSNVEDTFLSFLLWISLA